MALTRERKILGAVLALGLGGLAVDRVVLPSPVTGAQDASAALLTDYAAASLAEPRTAGAPTPAAEVLVQRLEALASTSSPDLPQTRDAFTPPAAWLSGTTVEGGVPAAGGAGGLADHHRLQAVMSDGQNGYAVVDGRPVHVGQEVAGMRLVEIRQRSAVFSVGQERVELRLPTQQP